MNQSLLTCQQLGIGYAGRCTAPPVSFQLPVQSSLGIIGGNGSGKTTLLKTIMGLIPPLGGSFKWKPGTRFGYVPQENQVDLLFPLTVSDVLKMGLPSRLPRWRHSSASLEHALEQVLEELEILPLKHSLFRDLSGGERQRALIARAWMSRPHVLLMDEPFSALDYRFKEKLWDIFYNWQKNNELSFIIIDHDLNRILNQVQWMLILGSQDTVFGPVGDVIRPEVLGRAYGAPLHVHQESDRIQVHFL